MEMAKEKKIQPLPPRKSQFCPKCGKEHKPSPWGETGFCDCGHYFHPEWYGRTADGKKLGNKKECVKTKGYEGTKGQDRENYTDTQDRDSYVPDMVFDDEGEEKLLKEAREKGKIK